MKAIGRGSLAAGLRVFLDVLRIALWALLGLAVLLTALSIYLYAVGSADSVLGVEIDRLDPWYVTFLAFAIVIGVLAAALIVVDRLRRIFATLSAGDPFVPENADHLRVIALVIAVYEIARVVMSVLAAHAVQASGAPSFVEAPLSPENALVWFGVLSLIVLAEVFREGARMRQEQKLTI